MTDLDPLALYASVLATTLAALKLVEQARRLRKPRISTSLFQLEIHDDAGVLDTAAIQITIANDGPLPKSITSCTVGLLNAAGDPSHEIAVEAEYRNAMVEYPVTVPPYSSAILYSFEHRLASIYVKRFGKDTLTKQVELRLAFAPGRNPERRLIGTYTPGPGLRPL